MCKRCRRHQHAACVTLAAGLCVVSATRAFSHAIDESASFLFALSNARRSHRGSLTAPLHRLTLYITTVCQNSINATSSLSFPLEFCVWAELLLRCKGQRLWVGDQQMLGRNSGWAQKGKQSASLGHNRQLSPDHYWFLKNKQDRLSHCIYRRYISKHFY